MSTVLDASVLIALLHDEPLDHDALHAHLSSGALMAAANFAELAHHALRLGWDEADLYDLLDGARITVVPLVENIAITAAQLVAIGKPLGLSLADRCCLATAQAFDAKRIFTTDRAWLDLPEPFTSKVVYARPA